MMHSGSQRLFTPGPVPVPEAVVRACSAQPLYHHSPAFRACSIRVWDALSRVYRTTQPVVMLAGSAMTGIEAAVVSLHGVGDRVLVLNNGRFAERCASVLKRYGCVVEEIVAEWGTSISPERVEESLRAMAEPPASVWITHSETSTGVTVDLQSIARVIRETSPQSLICVDAVTSMAVHRVETDAWDLDVVVSGIQKGLCCPPGLACVSLSERAQHTLNAVAPRSYTLDLSTVLQSYRTQSFTWTPPVTLIAGLDVALSSIIEVGMEQTWIKHQQVADHLRSRIVSLGLQLFGESTSNAVTAVVYEQANELQERLRTEHNMIVAGGQDRLAGNVIRIGTCGPYTIDDVDDICSALHTELHARS